MRYSFFTTYWIKFLKPRLERAESNLLLKKWQECSLSKLQFRSKSLNTLFSDKKCQFWTPNGHFNVKIRFFSNIRIWRHKQSPKGYFAYKSDLMTNLYRKLEVIGTQKLNSEGREAFLWPIVYIYMKTRDNIMYE